MLNHNQINYHVEYMDVSQHWCPVSEKYAGGDCLITALSKGWQMNDVIQTETRWFAGMRSINIYHIELHRNGEQMIMPVLDNPYIDKLLLNPELVLQPIENDQD
ncbi:MAG: hypothetical protein MUF87_00015 [Anaerolineae bacterium]|jgi:hypothetical protein|nr:hypothetical protein [Anaerolineae bacterium]